MNDKLFNAVNERIVVRVGAFKGEIVKNNFFYIGGNSLNPALPHDYDLFPVNDQTLELPDNAVILDETKNAKTFTVPGNDIVFQACNYCHESLETLVESFDYAHIQVGATIHHDFLGTTHKYEVKDLYFTEAYEESKLLENTWYTGSEYPLSSLVRLLKYHKRGDFAGNSDLRSVLSCVSDIVKRGYKDYDDFKDQMDAVDLGLILNEAEWTGEMEMLFDVLRRDQ